ncbi:tripartite motif-containing protein 16-like protein [Osmerus eperlanus]|uniref:tripartite motif-containing protein 16-like protein n=1 Tax=Osmerus eperlanus TaxID=29151 RepID=UPI002E0ED585
MDTLIIKEEDGEENHKSSGGPELPQTKEEPGDCTRPVEAGDNRGQPGDNPPQSTPLSPEDVLCDSCIERPCRALKSCLTCLVSYCEAHLRPHMENSKFHNHRLVEPLQDMEDRNCDLHNMPLELYCLTDGVCVCQECQEVEHRGHSSAPAGEARRQIETELQKKQGEIVKTSTMAENAISKLQRNNVSIESSVAGVRAVMEQEFGLLQRAAEEAKRGVAELLEAEQRQALSQAEGIQAHLEQRSAELKKTSARLERLCRNKIDVDFLQQYSEWKKGAVDVCLPEVHVSLMDHLSSFSTVVTEVTQELCGQLLSTYTLRLQGACKSEKLAHAKITETQPLSLPQPKTREGFLKYAIRLNFDPDTTHQYLRLTEDDRKVTNTTPWQHSYPDTPGRFDHWRQVMTSESLYLGRHYFEVELGGEGTHVGLSYKRLHRKGPDSRCCITGNDFSWCLGKESRGYSTWHAGVETPLDASLVTRAGIYVDFASGLLSFHHVTDSMTLLKQYSADFMEPLYATVWLSKKDNVVSLVSPEDPFPQNS